MNIKSTSNVPESNKVKTKVVGKVVNAGKEYKAGNVTITALNAHEKLSILWK